MSGPGPDGKIKLPTRSNTGGVTRLVDGAGVAWFAYRATSGPKTPSTVLYQHKDGRWIVKINEFDTTAYGGPTFVYTPDGYALLTSVNRDGDTACWWLVDERMGWVKR